MSPATHPRGEPSGRTGRMKALCCWRGTAPPMQKGWERPASRNPGSQVPGGASRPEHPQRWDLWQPQSNSFHEVCERRVSCQPQLAEKAIFPNDLACWKSSPLGVTSNTPTGARAALGSGPRAPWAHSGPGSDHVLCGLTSFGPALLPVNTFSSDEFHFP